MHEKNINEVIKRIEKLEAAVFSSESNRGKTKKSGKKPDLNFSINSRAYVKRFAKDLGPSQKFVLLLAYLTKGKISDEVPNHVIEKLWNSMTSKDLLGYKFNRKYSLDAKNEGWIDSKKRGFFILTNEWEEAYEAN